LLVMRRVVTGQDGCRWGRQSRPWGRGQGRLRSGYAPFLEVGNLAACGHAGRVVCGHAGLWMHVPSRRAKVASQAAAATRVTHLDARRSSSPSDETLFHRHQVGLSRSCFFLFLPVQPHFDSPIS